MHENTTPEEAILRYEEIKLEMKPMEAELDVLKPLVREVVIDKDEVYNTSTGLGVFTLKQRDNWVFSDKIKEQEKELKKAKADAIAQGEATSNPTIYPEYKANKVVEEE